jgi:hypothetical protein
MIVLNFLLQFYSNMNPEHSPALFGYGNVIVQLKDIPLNWTHNTPDLEVRAKALGKTRIVTVLPHRRKAVVIFHRESDASAFADAMFQTTRNEALRYV